MLEYRPPLRDIEFALDVIGYGDLASLGVFAHADLATVRGLLEEFGRLCSDVISPTNVVGDREGLRVDVAESTITTPTGFVEAYRRYVEGGWGAVSADPAYGGGGFPHTVSLAMAEMLQAANMSLALCPMLTQGSIEALAHWGSEIQKETYLPKLISGEWTGTMNLSEPDAGSDVGALRSRAVKAADGTWRIFGQKIFITWGEHDLAENIVHLVLARAEGSPTGTKGISCFIVPKFLVNLDGTLGARNDVRVVSTEHKMGIHASPTCVLAYGDGGEGAIGELIGDVDTGMRTMFTMMNNARLAVGQEGLAMGERAYQVAYDHAVNRVQGRVVGSTVAGEAIIGHPDVRRMLMTMRASVEAMRLLIFLNARALDESRHHPDATVRERAQERADLLTPLSKAWCTDLGVELASLGVQVGGGMGFCEDTGAAQLYRDARITPIYEGTNGIQALDLLGRKLPLRGGAVVNDLFEEMWATATALESVPALRDLASPLSKALRDVSELTTWLVATGARNQRDAMAGATPYLRVLATTVGAWLMMRQAIHAEPAATTDTFAAAKVATARFFVPQILQTIEGLFEQVRALSGPLDAIATEDLASC